MIDSILCDDGVCYTTMSVLSGEIPPLKLKKFLMERLWPVLNICTLICSVFTVTEYRTAMSSNQDHHNCFTSSFRTQLGSTDERVVVVCFINT